MLRLELGSGKVDYINAQHSTPMGSPYSPPYDKGHSKHIPVTFVGQCGGSLADMYVWIMGERRGCAEVACEGVDCAAAPMHAQG